MRLWPLALCLLGSLSAHAQSPVWALHGAHNTVYLAESMHLLKAGHAELPPAFDLAYRDAQNIVMEIDLSRLDETQMQEYALEHGTLKGGVTLQQALGQPVYQKLSTAVASLGLPLEVVSSYQPWFVALTVAELQYMKLGYDPTLGVEQQIEQRATQDHKQMSGLETLQQQLGQLEQLTPEQQKRFLELTLEDLQDADKETDELTAAWRDGETHKLAQLLSDEYKTFPELYRALVSERNHRWLPQIEGYLKDEHNYLVIVGALHVVGEDGLLELVRRDGLTAVPVRSGSTH
jgi:uncharacterized protein YbaP (TraB family)